ncbi:M23 family metallopeptidase [Streptomyces botrytidirepellens]|uniref:M23 family metallopeptidase n=1 Tax=Streptomyces botrytidirepellens TaxID=2486417 RepID=A0A3M8VLD8_9ACTN|nr:M23 family metallopeptidase [Streptomyces botrytidirepellens]RNG17797.1 M23 family metallopeptidase [Streptomyces botrytidirepellens]
MNDRHPSGATPTVPAPDASYSYDEVYGQQQDTAHGYAGYDGYSTGSFDDLGAAYGEADPLFGSLPGSYGDGQGDPPGGHSGQYDAAQWGDSSAYETGAYDTTAMWAASGYQLPTDVPTQRQDDTGGHWDAGTWDDTGAWDTHSPQQQWETGTYDTYGQYDAGTGQFDTGQFDTGQVDTGHFDTGQYDTGQYDTTGQFDAGAYDTGAYDVSGQYEIISQHAAYDTSGVDTGQTQFWDTSAYATVDESQYSEPQYDEPRYDDGTAPFEQGEHAEHAAQTAVFEAVAEPEPHPDPDPEPVADITPPPATATAATASRSGGRARRRTAPSRPKRSALLTVAVPSVCALGVTAVAAASVSGSMAGDKKDDTTTQAAPDAQPVKASVANSEMDTRLAGVDDGVNDFRERASRTQERIDLKERQEAEKKRKAAEAARKEAMRPKFALPVKQHGLSATFGQAGLNWMSLHTGIDFPVSEGTPVMAATDGTVRTQWNDAYGNMVILTAPDGTETWYCHLSSTKIRSGTVKAGDVMAYSGSSGNSTGPHLHFEVHPGGGDAVDPLPWLQSHGINPN